MNEKDIKFHILNKSSVYIEQKHTKLKKITWHWNSVPKQTLW